MNIAEDKRESNNERVIAIAKTVGLLSGALLMFCVVYFIFAYLENIDRKPLLAKFEDGTAERITYEIEGIQKDSRTTFFSRDSMIVKMKEYEVYPEKGEETITVNVKLKNDNIASIEAIVKVDKEAENLYMTAYNINGKLYNPIVYITPETVITRSFQ